MKRKWLVILVLILFLGINFSAVQALSYSFSVPTAEVNVYINPDGTASIEYTYVFQNSSGGDPIDFIDLGLPNSNYVLSTISAEVDGNKIGNIQKGDPQYVRHGITLSLFSKSIPPGATSTVHIYVGRLDNLLYYASEEEAEPYASFQFSPNYFDSSIVSGSTDMTVTLFLPPGLQPEEPRYFTPKDWPGAAEPQSGYDAEDRVYYRWQDSNANSRSKYVFGASFPARLLPEGVLQKPPTALGSLTGLIGEIFTEDNCICCGMFLTFGGFFAFIVYQTFWGARKRRLKYLPPKIAIEGHGIKRGLTAVQAAILMEQPMDKIMTMILFSTVKKGAATVTKRDPLEIEVTTPLVEGLQSYEIDFLKAFQNQKPAERRKDLQKMMVGLVKSITELMKGFSRKETITYYENIVNRAWQQVQQAETPEVMAEKIDEVMDWTMLDRKYEDRTREVFRTRPVYVPMWWGRYDPTFSAAGAGGGTVTASSSSPFGGKSISMPHLPGSDFAASMVKGVQSMSAGVIGDLTSFTGAVTDRTNPVPKTTSSGSGRSGGGGCACACACAGCACACAGGGR